MRTEDPDRQKLLIGLLTVRLLALLIFRSPQPAAPGQRLLARFFWKELLMKREEETLASSPGGGGAPALTDGRGRRLRPATSARIAVSFHREHARRVKTGHPCQ